MKNVVGDKSNWDSSHNLLSAKSFCDESVREFDNLNYNRYH